MLALIWNLYLAASTMVSGEPSLPVCTASCISAADWLHRAQRTAAAGVHISGPLLQLVTACQLMHCLEVGPMPLSSFSEWTAHAGALDQRVRLLERDHAQMAAEMTHARETAKSSDRIASVLLRDVARAQQVGLLCICPGQPVAAVLLHGHNCSCMLGRVEYLRCPLEAGDKRFSGMSWQASPSTAKSPVMWSKHTCNGSQCRVFAGDCQASGAAERPPAGSGPGSG